VGTGNYSATSNNMKLVHWPLMGGLLHLVQRGGDCMGGAFLSNLANTQDSQTDRQTDKQTNKHGQKTFTSSFVGGNNISLVL